MPHERPVKFQLGQQWRTVVNSNSCADHYMEDLHNGFKFEAGERYGRMFLLYKNCKSEVLPLQPLLKALASLLQRRSCIPKLGFIPQSGLSTSVHSIQALQLMCQLAKHCTASFALLRRQYIVPQEHSIALPDTACCGLVKFPWHAVVCSVFTLMCCEWQVVGIWFYDTEECEKVITLLKGIASQHPQPPQPPMEEGGASYPLTIGSLPHQNAAQPNVRLIITSPTLTVAFGHRNHLDFDTINTQSGPILLGMSDCKYSDVHSACVDILYNIVSPHPGIETKQMSLHHFLQG